MSNRKLPPTSARRNTAYRGRNNQTNLNRARSTDNLSSARDTISIDVRSVTLSRNGSLPNVDRIGDRETRDIDKETQLMLEYDKYLSSMELKYMFEKCENKIMGNINEETNVFMEEFVKIYEQLSTLTNELEKKKKLKIDKKNINREIEVLEILDKTIVFGECDEEILSTLSSTASKVVLKDFKELSEADIETVNGLLKEIIEVLTRLDYEDDINSRIQLKDLLIKVAVLTKDLDVYKSKCEELFNKMEHLQLNNSSMKILNTQFGENPDPAYLGVKEDLMKHFF